jgi:hypothetical protein
MPLLGLPYYSRLHVDASSSPTKLSVSAPASPTKTGGGLTTPPQSPSLAPPAPSEPKSPPTPHKIKLLENKELSPAASAFHKLKISLTPKIQSNNATAPAMGPKKRYRLIINMLRETAF